MVFVDKIPDYCDVRYQCYPCSPSYGFCLQEVSDVISSGAIFVTDIIPVDIIFNMKTHFSKVKVIWIDRPLSEKGRENILKSRGGCSEDLSQRLLNFHLFELAYAANKTLFDFTIHNNSTPIAMLNQMHEFLSTPQFARI